MHELLRRHIQDLALSPRDPRPLRVIGDDWQELVFEESINLQLMANSLAGTLLSRHPSPDEIHIRNHSSLTIPFTEHLKRRTNSRILFREHQETATRDPAVSRVHVDISCPYRHPTSAPADAPAISLNDTEVVADYVVRKKTHEQEALSWLTSLANDDRPLVIFVSHKTYFNQIRFSRALQAAGWRTIAITFDGANHEPKSSFFDDNLVTDLHSFLLALAQLPDHANLLLHTQGWLFRYHLPVLVDAFRPMASRQVVELMDSNKHWLEQLSGQQLTSLITRAWGDNAVISHERQLRCERYLVHHSDGLVFPGDESNFADLAEQGVERSPHISFCSYPLPEFFASTSESLPTNPVPSEMKLVFLGGVTPITPRHPEPLFHDSQMFRTAKLLVSQGFNLDVYNNPLRANTSDYATIYEPHLCLQKEHPDRYGFHVGDMPWLINQRISGYHFGLMLYDLDDLLIGDSHFRYMVPTKFFQYMEAGLPVLISDRWSAASSLVRQHNIGLVIDNDQLKNLASCLADVDLAELRRNVQDFRQQTSMHEEIHRLTALYSSLSARNKTNEPRLKDAG